jgi:putative flippase GtrA
VNATCPRVWPFVVVGAIGFGLQLALLAVLTRAHVPYLAATAIAVETTILHNFLWHERWTWRDRRETRAAVRLARLARFNLTTAVTSLVGTLVWTAALVEIGGAPIIIANAVAVAIVGTLNLVLADRVVFTATPGA